MAKKALSCPQCDRTFSMPGHLARHMSATHGVKSAKAKKPKRGRRGRPPGSGRAGRGRPKGVVSKLGLRDMSLEELMEVIDAAKAEARNKLEDLSAEFS